MLAHSRFVGSQLNRIDRVSLTLSYLRRCFLDLDGSEGGVLIIASGGAGGGILIIASRGAGGSP
jgi:hypothetical protein